MLISHNALVRHFAKWAVYSAQSVIGRNIAVLRQRYDIIVLDVNVCHVVKQCLL